MRHCVYFFKMDNLWFTAKGPAVSNAQKMEDGGSTLHSDMTHGYVTVSYNRFGFETEIWGAGVIVMRMVFPFTILPSAVADGRYYSDRWELKPLKG
jgi:hypothetical protein